MGVIKMERDRVSAKVCNIFHSSRQMAMEKGQNRPQGKRHCRHRHTPTLKSVTVTCRIPEHPMPP